MKNFLYDVLRLIYWVGGLPVFFWRIFKSQPLWDIFRDSESIDKWVNEPISFKIIKSDWYTINVCESCEIRLSNNDIYHSDNTCKKCGNYGAHLTPNKPITLREIKQGNRVTYEGRGEDDKKWAAK